MTPRAFSVDARALLHLGRESIRDQVTAVIELVKNSYDADATRVDIDIVVPGGGASIGYVRVRDNGSGMTDVDLDEKWLRIGYSAKRERKVSEVFRRRTTGEKGIGRISSDRLGSKLELVSAAPKKQICGLAVDWSLFETPERSISDVAVATLSKPKFRHEEGNKRLLELKVPEWTYGTQGTEVTAHELRGRWTPADISQLRTELSAFLSPFEPAADFEIFLLTNVSPELSGQIETVIPSGAAVELSASFDGASELTYSLRIGDTKKSKVRAKIEQLVQHGDKQLDLASAGPVSVRFLFIPRTEEASVESKISLRRLKDFLDDNSGVRIYRDGIRVRPYGDPTQPQGDWLQLGDRKSRNPAGAGRPSFRVAPNQLVGAVFVTRDGNPLIVDSAGREGLINNPPMAALRAVALACVGLLEAAYHERHQAKKESTPTPHMQLGELKNKLSNLATKLSDLKLAPASDRVARIQSTLSDVDQTVRMIGDAHQAVERIADQATIYRGLASTGIAATVFGHETQTSIAKLESSLALADVLLLAKPPKVAAASTELAKARRAANQVGSWGSFALHRVQRDKRRRRTVDVRALLERLLGELDAAFAAVGIKIRTALDSVSGRTFAMDVESVALNLLTNAYAACLHVSNKREIRVELRPVTRFARPGMLLVVADSGPGVAPELASQIWQPLFSTRVDGEGKAVGTGLGLAIVTSVVDDLNGSKEVGRDSRLAGARFEVWLPLN